MNCLPSREGWVEPTFHLECDYKKETLTLIDRADKQIDKLMQVSQRVDSNSSLWYERELT